MTAAYWQAAPGARSDAPGGSGLTSAAHSRRRGADIRLSAQLSQAAIDQVEQRYYFRGPFGLSILCARLGIGELGHQGIELIDESLKVGVFLGRPPPGGVEQSADVSAHTTSGLSRCRVTCSDVINHPADSSNNRLRLDQRGVRRPRRFGCGHVEAEARGVQEGVRV